jgi:hypothetical protein
MTQGELQAWQQFMTYVERALRTDSMDGTVPVVLVCLPLTRVGGRELADPGVHAESPAVATLWLAEYPLGKRGTLLARVAQGYFDAERDEPPAPREARQW